MDRKDQPITIKYFCEETDSRAIYVFDFLFSIIGVKAELVEEVELADIIYAGALDNLESGSNKLWINRSQGDLIWKDLLEDKITDPENYISFDIIHAIGAFLSDEVNADIGKEGYDKHDRLKLESSFQFRKKIHAFPIVNKYVAEFRRRVSQVLNVTSCPLYPDGKKMCILLTHDVDIPDKRDELRNYTFLPHKRGGQGAFKHYKRFLGLITRRLIDKNPDEYWTFEELFRAESEHGFKSTSFFASISRWDEIGHFLDVPYLINDEKYIEVLKDMKEQGFEFGLHASYDAYQGTDRFKEEKKRLEEAGEGQVIGLRHHFWHLSDKPNKTLKMHEDAGFLYDASLSFNDAIGFRNNVALPYFPYNASEERAVNVLQLPTFCMDGNLFYEGTPTPDEAVDRIKVYVDSIKEHEGVGSIDWHIRASYPKGKKYKAWGEAYLALLEYLAEDDEVWVTSCSDFYDWWTVKRFE